MTTAKDRILAKRRADRAFKNAWDKRNGEAPPPPASVPQSLGDGFDEDTPLLPAAALDKTKPDGERLAALAPLAYAKWNGHDAQPD